MAHIARKRFEKSAFTLLELLVVVAIIMLLVGLLAPGIKVFKRAADNLKQKSVFHGFETALELFSDDFDGYPDSDVLPDGGTTDLVCGAQHLAEALVGRDQRGFEPKTGWYPPDDELYEDDVPEDLYENIPESLNRRKSPYTELKKDVGAYTIGQLFDDSKNVYTPTLPVSEQKDLSPVFTDVFHRKKITLTGSNTKIKVGSPILYFKADATSRYFLDDMPVVPETSRWIFDYEDNRPIMELGNMMDQTIIHQFDDDYQDPLDSTRTGWHIFYDTITNPTVERFKKPFNSKTFILMSAGWDGIFGTKDDIYNFDY
jgi:type II secretory pathway pseudopilin PulG